MFYGGTGPLRRIARNLLMIWIPMLLSRKTTQQREQLEQKQATKEECVDEPREGATGQSLILGKSYKAVRKHQPLPKLEQPRIFKNQVSFEIKLLSCFQAWLFIPTVLSYNNDTQINVPKTQPRTLVRGPSPVKRQSPGQRIAPCHMSKSNSLSTLRGLTIKIQGI